MQTGQQSHRRGSDWLFGQWLLNPRLCGLTIDHEEQKEEELKTEMEYTEKDVSMISKLNTKD